MYKVYKYGLSSPTNEAIIADQLVRKGRYWNRLVELEHQYDAQVEEALVQAQPYLDLLDGDDLRQERKLTFALPEVKAQLQQLGQQRTAAIRQARHQYGLYWGNYQDVELAYKTARRRPGDLKFHRPRPEGCVSVWWPHGLPVAQVWGTDQCLQIGPVDPQAWSHPLRTTRRRLARTWFRFRVQSDERHHPVWAEGALTMHRPLPDAGVIRKASLVREHIGTHCRYSLVVTVASEDAHPTTPPAQGAVALDLGWRHLDGHLRVAYTVDVAGGTDVLTLDSELLAAFARVRDIQSIRDQNFNLARKCLVASLKDLASVPAWLEQAAQTLSQWRSPGRLASLALQWRTHQFETGAGAYSGLEAWRRKDKHLLEYAANLEDRVRRHRRESYRVFAARLVRQYSTIVLEDLDLHELGARERGALRLPNEDWHRKIAAVNELRLAIENASRGVGATVVRLPAAYTTQTCWGCGERNEFDAIAELHHQCRCGRVWDQDENAARNLLRAYTTVQEAGCSQIS